MKNKKQKKSSVKTLSLLGLAALIAALAVVWFVNRHQEPSITPVPETNTTAPGKDGVNYGPPTEQDKQEATANKEELSQPPTNTPPSTAQPGLTYVGEYDGSVEASGYAQNVYEDGGTCKYAFIHDDKQISRQTTGFKDARRTVCPSISIPRSEFTQTGTWKVTLFYSSNTASGTSTEQMIELK